jgi:hypothetical protein
VAESTFQRNSDEDIPVGISVSPALQKGHRLEILLDGKIANGLASVQAANLERGSHQILARVVDAAGKTLTSSSVTFYIQQPSVLIPRGK